MNDQQAGRLLRAFRRQRGLRQADLAALAGSSQSTESLAERGHLDHLAFGTIRRLFAACEASVGLDVRPRGGEADRLLDAAHAALVQAVGEYLARHGWTCWFEVTYSHFGERGSIDVLAVRNDAVLVVEVKSELTSVEATLRKLDEKVRQAARIVFERTGRRPVVIGRLLVLPETTTSRDHVARHGTVFGSALPGRAVAMRAWLRSPSSPFAGILFLRGTRAGDRMRRSASQRLRISRNAAPGTRPTGKS